MADAKVGNLIKLCKKERMDFNWKKGFRLINFLPINWFNCEARKIIVKNVVTVETQTFFKSFSEFSRSMGQIPGI